MNVLAPPRQTAVRARQTPLWHGAAVPARSPDARWHLVLVRTPGWQSVEDWNAIARHVVDIEPRIACFVVRGDQAHSVIRRRAARLPALVFSPGPIARFRPLRGRVYHGAPMAKVEQVRRLAAAGVPVPRTALLTPDLELDPAVWGELVILKPSDLGSTSQGIAVNLMRTRRVRYRPPLDYPAGHPARFAPMIVQEFIDTGEHITVYRTLTLFGEPLYMNTHRAEAPRPSLDAPDAEIERHPMALQGIRKEKDLVIHADVIAVARAAYAAIPEVPLQGCDILRDVRSGRLYVLEINPGGNTWHFSSDYLAASRAANGAAFERQRREQFDGLRTAARILAERTRNEAA